jgi:hypothetical protein
MRFLTQHLRLGSRHNTAALPPNLQSIVPVPYTSQSGPLANEAYIYLGLALMQTTAELQWIQSFLKEYIIGYLHHHSTYLTAILMSHACTKHIEINFHFVHNS